jgi:hypothetical protein
MTVLLPLFVTQTEPAANSTSYEPRPILIRFASFRVRVLIRSTSWAPYACVHTLPAPAVIPQGCDPMRICLPTARFFAGSTTDTLLEPKFVTQRSPRAWTDEHGCFPTRILATTTGSEEGAAAATAAAPRRRNRTMAARRSMTNLRRG